MNRKTEQSGNSSETSLTSGICVSDDPEVFGAAV
jgi:hypothetical protein